MASVVQLPSESAPIDTLTDLSAANPAGNAVSVEPAEASAFESASEATSWSKLAPALSPESSPEAVTTTVPAALPVGTAKPSWQAPVLSEVQEPTHVQ